MSDPREREAIARIIYDDTGILGQKCYGSQEATDRIIAEHIEPLRAALAKAEAERDRLAEGGAAWVSTAQAHLARASALEAQLSAVREALGVSVYDSRPLSLHAENMVYRASALEALLAECEAIIERWYNSPNANSYAVMVDLLTKLKART